MERKVKCYGSSCVAENKKYFKSQMIESKSKRYCEPCFGKIEKQKRHRDALYHFIEEYSGVTFPTGRMLKQIKNFREEKNYTYFGILKSLEFMLDVRHKSLRNDYFLGYVPFVYEDAKEWYIEELKRQKALEAQSEEHKDVIQDIDFTYKFNGKANKGLVEADNLLD